MPWRSGTAPSVSPVPPERGTTGTPKRLAIFTISATSSVLPGRTTASGVWSAQRWTGNGAGTRARCMRAGFDVIRWSAPRTCASSSSARSSMPAGDRGAHRRPRCPSDSASSSCRSTTSICRASPASRQRPLRPRAGGDERVDLELGGVLQPPLGDLRGQLGLLDREPRAGAAAVRPLGDAVDVAEVEAGDRAQDLARLLPDPLALVQPARVVVGDRALDRHAPA